MIIERDFLDHWKTTLLCSRLGDTAPFGLLRLWAHCEARRDDRFILTAAQLWAIVRLRGTPEEVEAALIEGRWIDREGDAVVVRGWRERNAGLLARVQAGKDRQAALRKQSTQQPATCEAPHSQQPASSEQAGTDEMRVDERRGEEKRTPPTPGAGAPEGGASPGSVEAILATEDFLIRLFSPKGEKQRAQLNDTGRRALRQWKDLLPLSEKQRDWLAWFYGLPNPDRADFDLKCRKQTPEALADVLFAEIERAMAYGEKNPRARSAGTRTATPAAAEPEGWREWLAEQYPAQAAEYTAWADLPESVRSEFQLSRPSAGPGTGKNTTTA